VKNALGHLVRKPEGKEPLSMYRNRYEDDIKIDNWGNRIRGCKLDLCCPWWELVARTFEYKINLYTEDSVFTWVTFGPEGLLRRGVGIFRR